MAQTRKTFWTPERDAQLRDLWATKMPLADMVRKFDGAVTGPYISKRAMHLGLPALREVSRERQEIRASYAITPPVRPPASYHRGVAEPNNFAGQDPVTFAETPARRPAPPPPTETPCPYFDPYAKPDPETGRIHRCGVMVNRRPRKDGSKPPQYCEDHAPRVLPTPDGSRAGARFLRPVTRAGIVGML